MGKNRQTSRQEFLVGFNDGNRPFSIASVFNSLSSARPRFLCLLASGVLSIRPSGPVPIIDTLKAFKAEALVEPVSKVIANE